MFQKPRIVYDAIIDGLRRSRHFGAFRNPKKLIQDQAELQKDIHLIERALALPEPRRPFGQKPEARIKTILERRGDQLPASLLAQVTTALADLSAWNDHGVRPTEPELQFQGSLDTFLASRRSVRAFSSTLQPSAEQLEEIVALASQAPSVSNTQSWKVRAYQQPEDIKALLSLQDGNVGNSTIPTLLLVSVDIRSFTGANERNQMWIDGGIFLQQLLLAIHAKGWGRCRMNFSATNNQAAKLRSLAGLADYEEVIAFVSVGERDKSIAPAASIRKPVGDLLVLASLPTSR